MQSGLSGDYEFPGDFMKIPLGVSPEIVFVYFEYLKKIMDVSMIEADQKILEANIPEDSEALCDLPDIVQEAASWKWGGAGSVHVECPYNGLVINAAVGSKPKV